MNAKILKIFIFTGLFIGIALGLTGLYRSKTGQSSKESVLINEKDQTRLKSRLDEKKNAFNQQAPDRVKTAYRDGIQAVVDSGVVERAKQVGDQAPDFKLVNAAGEPVWLSEYLKKGPVILTWYRGGWCPYCNLTLRALQEELPAFKALGAHLIALTPELPDQSLSTAEKHGLEFEVLSDIDSRVAKEYGLVYTLTDEVAKLYDGKFDLKTYNGNNSHELPLAATYIIDPDGSIVYAFLDADYRNRAEPADIRAALQANR